MTLTDLDREFLVVYAELRLAGCHPEWRYMWRGSFEIGEHNRGRMWLDAVGRLVRTGRWPIRPHHFEHPEKLWPADHEFVVAGKAWWDKYESEQHAD